MFNKSHWEIIMLLFYLSLIDTEEEKSKFEKLLSIQMIKMDTML